MVKMLRTRNRFSASSVDQIPHQLVAWQLYGHQLLLPIPDIDRTSYFLVLRRQPDGLQRLADDRARLPATGCATSRRAAAGWSSFDPRRTETAKVADEHHFVRPGSDAVVAAGDGAHAVRGGPDPPGAVRRPGRPRARAASSPSPPKPPSGSAASPADDVRRLARELAAADGGAAYGRIGVSTTGLRHPWRSGASSASTS